MPLYKNRNWLENKYIDEKLSTKQIGKLCGVNNSTIRYYMRKYNIPRRSISEGKHFRCGNHCNLSIEAIEWINGELLGDGCLYAQSKYSALITYASKHLEYIEYVRDTLKSFGIEQSGGIYKQYHKNMDCYSYHYNSRSYPELLTIKKNWYPEGKKIVPRDIELTPLTIRQWYIGDGSLLCNRKYRRGILLATYGFLVAGVEWLIKQLLELGIKASKTGRNAIYISVYSIKSFLDYIGKCPVECYKYKWGY